MKNVIISLLLLSMAVFAFAGTVVVSPSGNEIDIRLISSTPQKNVFEVDINRFNIDEVAIENDIYRNLFLSGEGFILEEGNPQLPFITRSFIVPNKAKMEARIMSYEYIDLEMNIAPSKGKLYRNQNPDTIPHRFSEIYSQDSFYPEILVETRDPFIIRDFRGQTVVLYPFQYNPVTGSLRVYKNLVIEFVEVGESEINVLEGTRNSYSKDFADIYSNLFINFTPTRYPLLAETGRMIVISHANYLEAIQPFVDWKNQKGIQTDLYSLSQIGTTTTAIKNFIQTQYNLNDGLTFVQLVGDAPQVPTFSVGGGGSDPTYSLLAGNDSYPDIFVGRFSAETVAQLNTQVTRTIHYERNINTTDTWLSKAVGIASSEGSNPSDIQHMNGIRSRLLNYNYTQIDQIHDPGASVTQVNNAVNPGRGFINYVGHGSTTSWVTSNFSNTNVNALTNDNKLPFIVSVACINGNFTSSTCFAEAWLRATNNATGNPTGAIAMYASTVNQAWYPPMTAQNEITDLMIAESRNSIGGLYYNGSSRMIEVWNNDGISEFKNWHIFGDASLQVRSATPQLMTVTHDPSIPMGSNSFTVMVNSADALVSLTRNSEIIASGTTNNDGVAILTINPAFNEPEVLQITVTAYNKVTYMTDIEVGGATAVVGIDSFEILNSNNGEDIMYNDTARVNISLINSGVEPAVNVSAIISTDDPYITITDNLQIFGNLNPEQSISINSAFAFNTANNIPDQREITVNVAITDDSGAWNDSFSFIVNAPALGIEDIIIYDVDANDNGQLDPGEELTFYLPIVNNGGADSPPVFLQLTTNNNFVTINDISDIAFSVIAVDTKMFPAIDISVGNDIQPGTNVTFNYQLTSGNYNFTGQFNSVVGGVVSAQIGTGTSTSGTENGSPINIYYKSLRGQSVYTTAELNAAGINSGGSINQLGFYVTQAPQLALPNFIVRMRHTIAANSSSHIGEPYTTVYTNNSYMPTAGGWDMLNLTTPFVWDGVSNILVDTAFAPVTNYSSSGQVRVSPINNGYRFVRNDYSDQTNSNTSQTSSAKPHILFKISTVTEEDVVRPENFSALLGDGIVLMTWEAPRYTENRNPLGYNVYRNGIKLNNQLITVTEYSDSDFDDGITNYYYATAVYQSGETVPSYITKAEQYDAVETPVFNPAPGHYNEEIVVSITTTTEDALIYYTIDGSEPNEQSNLYDTPITISFGTEITIKAQAYKNDLMPSSVITGIYTISNILPAPQFEQETGVYLEPLTVGINSQSADWDIRYTLDNTTPNENSPIYTEPILINISKTIKARIYAEGWQESAVAEASYTILNPPLNLSAQSNLNSIVVEWEEPLMSERNASTTRNNLRNQQGDNYREELTGYRIYRSINSPDNLVFFTETENTSHTLNNLTPATYYFKVKAVYAEGESNYSNLASAAIQKTETPQITPAAGIYYQAFLATLSCATPNAAIYYTIDGTEPDSESIPYEAPFQINLNTQLKVRAYKDGLMESDIATANYTILYAPSGLSLMPTVDSVYLNWNAPQSNTERIELSKRRTDFRNSASERGLLGYNVFRAINTGSFIQINTNLITQEYYHNTGLTPGDYRYYIKAVYGEGASLSSETVSVTINGAVSPQYHPAPGYYSTPVNVSLSTTTSNAVIYYTLDGSTPNNNSSVFEGTPITINETTTLKSIAVRAGWQDSEVSIATYTIQSVSTDTPDLYSTQLLNAFPNPFNPETTIRFSLGENNFVRINIYNVSGQKVKTLLAESLNQGNHSVVWNGTDDSGATLPTGLYFYKMETTAYQATKKILLMK